jgi:hypothetical protein
MLQAVVQVYDEDANTVVLKRGLGRLRKVQRTVETRPQYGSCLRYA